VALCLQQHGVTASHIPSVKTRVLTGLYNVDRWTEQAIWNTVLQGVRVVVSTHAVLADALNHGFVRMSQLNLMIFDEGMMELCFL
jgi:ERCC4-related helicase